MFFPILNVVKCWRLLIVVSVNSIRPLLLLALAVNRLNGGIVVSTMLRAVAIWPPNSSPLRPSAPCYSGHALPSSPTLRFTHNTICSTTFSPLHATFILVKMTSERSRRQERVSACELFRLSEKATPTDESRSQLMLLLVLAAAANNKLLLLTAPYCCLLLVLTVTTIRSR